MTQIEFITGILDTTGINRVLPQLTIEQLAASARASRTLGQIAIDMMSSRAFGGFGEIDQTRAGEWLESMALSLTEAADRFIAELRTRRPNDPDDRQMRALALIEYGVITNDPAPEVAALAASLAAHRH